MLAAPGANATVSGTPTLTVNNVPNSGPVGQIVYRFEVPKRRRSPAPCSCSGRVNESERLSFTPSLSRQLSGDDALGAFRRAIRSNAVTSSFSNGESVQVPAVHAVSGDDCQFATRPGHLGGDGEDHEHLL